ncbi:Protein prenyltransferase alpha subunit repeat-containing protein 1 [Tieghemiomyces parasiticus]|uniref:Protein prenyltransferase alpha subunit repeat-containing protein 1 n=1 Tax=Tieghemiomyces parasiticus TaxID=78921 RepID=A0A9W8ACM6_9FUNG|nr:Protein prenyltransferase alpha subunit repeat-containing protein 1 [Tieghemiomyces parasiticus]
MSTHKALHLIFRGLIDDLDCQAIVAIEMVPGLNESACDGPAPTDHGNKPYYPFEVAKGTLGIPTWACPLLFDHLHRLRKHGLPSAALPTRELMSFTQSLLILNHRDYSAWNQRKRWLLLNGTREDWHDEMRLTALVLGMRKRSSCDDVWNHRKWTLRQLQRQGDQRAYLGYLANDYVLCDQAATAYPRLYYAWTYRQFLDRSLLAALPDPEFPGALNLFDTVGESLWQAWAGTHRWLRLHVSDHSAGAYGLALTRCLTDYIDRCPLTVHHDQARRAVEGQAGPLAAFYRISQRSGGLGYATSDDQSIGLALTGCVITLHSLATRDLLRLYPTHEALWCNFRHGLALAVAFNRRHQGRLANQAANGIDWLLEGLQYHRGEVTADLAALGIVLTVPNCAPSSDAPSNARWDQLWGLSTTNTADHLAWVHTALDDTGPHQPVASGIPRTLAERYQRWLHLHEAAED